MMCNDIIIELLKNKSQKSKDLNIKPWNYPRKKPKIVFLYYWKGE